MIRSLFRKIAILIVVLFGGLILSCSTIDETNEPPKRKLFTSMKGLVNYEFSADIEQRLESDSSLNANDLAAFQLSNIGKYFDALKIFDQSYTPEAEQLIFFDTSEYRFAPALDHICRLADSRRVVIINEAHHVSYHRFFSMLLIQRLKDLGFNYFGAETLNPRDSSLNERDHPLMWAGYYTVEPQYGNLIRTALKQNYTLFAYEATETTTPMQREIDQARNIERILKDKNAKVVIHCGYSHLYEGEMEGWGKAMAGRLTEFTGIDPLTIDQVEFTEHWDARYENAYFKKMNFSEFVIPVPKAPRFTLGFRRNMQTSDVFVYHPRTKLVHNRPDWLFRYYLPYFINQEITIDFPVLCKAFIATEDTSEAVPLDVIEIDKQGDSTALALLPNKEYKIVVINREGGRQVLERDLRTAKSLLFK